MHRKHNPPVLLLYVSISNNHNPFVSVYHLEESLDIQRMRGRGAERKREKEKKKKKQETGRE